MKVLVAEDNANDRRLLKINLEHRGCTVIEAADGNEGLELTKKHIPDLIIADALMPVMDGYQFLRTVKQDEQLKSIPFIFYSAIYTGHEEARLAISLGAEAFIIKPKEPEELWEEIRDLLEGCKLRNENKLTARLIQEEEEFLSKYSHIVASNLEKKVHELEAAKTKIEASEQSYRNLFSSIRDAIILADKNRVIQDANQPALREIFGYELNEVVGKSSRMLYADDAGFQLPGKEIFDHEGYVKAKIFEIDFRKNNGDVFRGELFAHKLIGENGRPEGNMALIRDISDRMHAEKEKKKLEEQLLQAQKMEAVGQLAGGIAHDFNNILTAILGYGNLITMKMKDDDPLKINVEQILASSERAAHLTHSLLAFSRKQVISLRYADLNAIVRKVEKFLSRIIGEDLELRTRLYDKELTVYVDPGQIEQVLMNLATNARDSMQNGGVLTIETDITELTEEFAGIYQYGKAGEYAVLAVSDTGIGMDEHTRLKIFEPFFTTKEVGKGTGLGLAMSYGIIKQHEGYINCYSEPGKGTTFRIYLPVVKRTINEEVSKVIPPLPPARGTETILIAEDDETLRKLIGTVFKEFGYSVIEAVDGEDAMTKFIENKDNIHLVVFDVIMPKKNGREAFEEIRKIKPDIKALFVSGYTADIMQKRGLIEEGAVFLYKPVSPVVLLRKVRDILDSA